MFVSIKDNKYQILVSSVLGLCIYIYTNNETSAMIFTLITSILLRYFHFDNKVNSILKQK